MLNLIEKYKHIITDYKVKRYFIEGPLFSCVVRISFFDESSLDIKEYRFSNNERKYSFHWMDQNSAMIIRWDNATHWKNISTFPHHKHIGEKVFPSTEISLEQVFAFIERKIFNQKS